MQLVYTYKRRFNYLGVSLWEFVSASTIYFEKNASIENSCSNERFGAFLTRLSQVILSGEVSNYKTFALKIETLIKDDPIPYRYYHFNFIYKNNLISPWRELSPYDPIPYIKQSDVEGAEKLHSDPGINDFFIELRDQFKKNRFPSIVDRPNDELAIFLNVDV